MTPLRRRMLEDMQLRGLSERTQETYLRAVRQLAEHYGVSPDQLTEEEIRQYFVFLHTEKHLARASCTIALCAIKFFYWHTLRRQWERVEDEADGYPGRASRPGTVALDSAIGDPAYVGKGHGRRLVLEFVHHVLRTTMPDCPEVWIDPDPRNERAVRAYQAAGFTDTGIDLPDLDHPDQVRRLMKMSWAGPTFR